jgi:hypothetical protein
MGGKNPQIFSSQNISYNSPSSYVFAKRIQLIAKTANFFKTASRHMFLSFTKFADKFCLFSKKFKEKLSLLYFRKHISQKCEDDFRKNAWHIVGLSELEASNLHCTG